MNKRNKLQKFNYRASHRKALLRNLAVDFFNNEEIKTNIARAKALRSYVEKLITKAIESHKETTSYERKIHLIRLVASSLSDKEALYKLFNDIAKRNLNRFGGYTRLFRLSCSHNDKAEILLLQLVEKKSLFEIKESRKKIKDTIKNKKIGELSIFSDIKIKKNKVKKETVEINS